MSKKTPSSPTDRDAPEDGAAGSRGSARASSKSKPKRAVPDEADTFINEVTEELRKDRLNAAARTYGPYAAAGVVAIVLAAAGWEYYKAASADAARQAGTALAEAATAAEFQAVADSVSAGPALLARFRAADALRAEGEIGDATAILRAIADDPSIDLKFRDLATLKSAMAELDDTGAAERIAADLEPLTLPGALYRPLALELRATALLKLDRVDAARVALQDAMDAPDAPRGVATRAAALLDALGGPIDDGALDAPLGDGDG